MTTSRTASWLFTVALVALAGFLLSAIGLAGPLRSGAGTVTEPLVAVVAGITSPIVDLVGNVGSYGDLREDNRALRVENERLQADLAQLREERARAADVDGLLNLKESRRTDTLAFASVIGRDPNPQREVIEVNRGETDGVREGMPVLGRGGTLVGTVERVQRGTSWVRLITDPKSDVNAQLQESRVKALASGGPGGALTMELLAQGIEVKPGDTVVTSGLGGMYPKELYIGRVAQVEGGTLDVIKKVRIEPAVRLSTLESIAIVTSFQPLRLGER